MDNIDNLPDGIAARLRQLEDEEDDEVDYSIPTTWGANNTSDVFQSEARRSSLPSSSASNNFATSDSSRSFARAFAPLKKHLDPYELWDQQRAFSFASAVRAEPSTSNWDSYDLPTPDQSKTSRKSRRQEGQASATGDRGDVNDPCNNALEGTFGSTSVKRVTDEGSEWLDLTLPELDPDLENPDLDIDPNIRANFLSISQLHRAPVQRSSFAIRNPNLVASNTNSAISTVLGGETITYTPKSGDSRLGKLDRHGNYIGKYEGEIKKSLKRQYIEDVRERDRQMLQATAEYRALAAMTAEERADLLERLRKPYEWEGTFSDDQHDEPYIPEVYTREIPTDRVLKWMEDDFSEISIARTGSIAPSDPGSSLRRRVDSVSSHGPLGDFDDVDDFVAGSSFVPLAKPVPRTQQYFRDVLHYGSRRASGKSTSQRSSSTVGTQITAQIDRSWLSNAGTSPSVTASSRGLGNSFSFDDSPEFEIPADCTIESEAKMTPQQEQFYKYATSFSNEKGRVVLVHLHQLVKFTPGAIASRVFGGNIQAMQLFPVQRVAIVIFLHPSEARAFVRHVKKVHDSGRQEEIRALQIEAGWYNGIEKPDSILPIHPNILTHHIASNATRCLRLHHLPSTKTKEEVSSELGRRLAMPLMTMILCPPKLAPFRSGRDGQAVRDARLDRDALLGSEARLGRQAIVEFVSISDAICARKLLREGVIEEYEDCEPVFAGDPSARQGTERDYCSCAGCRYQRKERGARRMLRREGESVD